ncbi:MAG TPA: SMC-Scp complex subunit ScpB [Microlunatus sp.]|jgi:segregation and condensation protein B|nr:SMC-Scp complex subunit ScpB [Microlunatus sp.]
MSDTDQTADLNEAATPTTSADPPTIEDIGAALEALLLIADEPMPETELAAALGAPTHVVADALAELVAFYDETGRGFELRQIGGGWRYYTREEHAELVGRYLLDGQQAKLSQAALETLAVVAYQQPISRARISAVRGVSVDGVMRTLLTRGLVAEAGHDHESGAILFRTTGYFLERMGLRSLDDLPALAPHLPEVDELEAELSQLARPQAVPEESAPESATARAPELHHEREHTDG